MNLKKSKTSIHQTIHLSVYPSIYPSIHPSIHPSIYPSIETHIHLTVLIWQNVDSGIRAWRSTESTFKSVASAKIERGAPSTTVGAVNPGRGLATLGSPGSALEFQAIWVGGGGGVVQRFALFQQRLLLCLRVRTGSWPCLLAAGLSIRLPSVSLALAVRWGGRLPCVRSRGLQSQQGGRVGENGLGCIGKSL